MSRGTVFVTGGLGFIGRHLSRHCSSQGYSVAGLGHGALSNASPESYGMRTWLNADVTSLNLGVLARAAGDPDIIFHLAGGSSVGIALANPREDFHRSVESTIEILEWMRQRSSPARLVVVSSAAVYGNPGTGSAPLVESTPTRPVSPYGHHKLIMEDLSRSYSQSYGLRCVIARVFSVYGAGLRKQLLWDLCSKLQAGAPITLGGTGEELRDWINISDLCVALAEVGRLADTTAPILNVGTGIATSVRSIAELTCRAWDEHFDTRTIRFSGESRPGDPTHLVADTTRLGELGVRSRVPLPAGITAYVSWIRQRAGAT